MRASSLTNLGAAVGSTISSEYDKVIELAQIAEEIETLAPYAAQIAEIVANLPDVLTVEQAVDIINNLSVVVTQLPENTPATGELVGTEIRLGIPQGNQGPRGYNGLTPQIEFSMDANGNLVYDVVDWIDLNTGDTINRPAEEW